MARRAIHRSIDTPALLARLITAAQHGSRERASHLGSGAVADALRDLGGLAQWAVPVHGVFVPNHSDVSTAIESVARAHLQFDIARREFRKALAKVPDTTERDDIASAHTHVRSVSDEAYFYAGLVFGVTISSLSSTR
jgi:hypothetical protein